MPQQLQRDSACAALNRALPPLHARCLQTRRLEAKKNVRNENPKGVPANSEGLAGTAYPGKSNPQNQPQGG